jgi:hypothetical protein
MIIPDFRTPEYLVLTKNHYFPKVKTLSEKSVRRRVVKFGHEVRFASFEENKTENPSSPYPRALY